MKTTAPSLRVRNERSNLILKYSKKLKPYPMTFFFQYLLRLSICFAIMYLFYAIVLRRLTFYNHNRWYLLGYSVLCFIIPLVHFASDDTGIIYSNVVQMIPVVTVSEVAGTHAASAFDVYQLLGYIFVIGIAVMLARLLMQLLAYKKLTSNATIISSIDTVKLYQINREIVPFSFGNAIFINQDLHDEAGLKEILQHEFVHVKQKHTLDILWGEILCILNWYNPFVWLIRRAIRENLEFIADDKVIQTGIEKHEYQYLLLRVMGNNNFSIANNFNFSSLKKRIAMMNKIKTAKIHLLKFLFLIPLLGVLLVSFRDTIKTLGNADTITISGVVMDADNLHPLSSALVKDKISNAEATTDEKGFYTINIDYDSTYNIVLLVSKQGFQKFSSSSSGSTRSNEYLIANIKLQAVNSNSKNGNSGAAYQMVKTKPDYNKVLAVFNDDTKRTNLENKLKTENKIVSIQKGELWIVGENCSATYNSTDYKIYVDGKLMTPDEINATVSAKDIVSISSKNASEINIKLRKHDTSLKSGKDTSQWKSGFVKSQNSSQIKKDIDSDKQWKLGTPELQNQDTGRKLRIVIAKDVPVSSNEEFKKQNPEVDNWLTSYGIKDSASAPDRLLYTVYLKNGETEKYDFSNPREFKKFLKKYKSIPPETIYRFTPIGREPQSN